MQNDLRWIRYISIEVGSIDNPESKLTYYADGSLDGMRITGQINLSALAMPDYSNITIFNLSKRTRDTLAELITRTVLVKDKDNLVPSNAYIRVFATYLTPQNDFEGQRLQPQLLISARIWSIRSLRHNADIATMFVIRQDDYFYKGVSDVNVKAGTTMGSAVRTIFKDLPEGYTLNNQDLQKLNKIKFSENRNFGANMAARMEELRNCGLNVYMDGQQIRIIPIGDATDIGILALTEDTGLLNVDPLVESDNQLWTGLQVKSLLLPQISLCQKVAVKSALMPKLNGVYRVFQIKHTFDSHGQDWFTELRFDYMLENAEGGDYTAAIKMVQKQNEKAAEKARKKREEEED